MCFVPVFATNTASLCFGCVMGWGYRSLRIMSFNQAVSLGLELYPPALDCSGVLGVGFSLRQTSKSSSVSFCHPINWVRFGVSEL